MLTESQELFFAQAASRVERPKCSQLSCNVRVLVENLPEPAVRRGFELACGGALLEDSAGMLDMPIVFV